MSGRNFPEQPVTSIKASLATSLLACLILAGLLLTLGQSGVRSAPLLTGESLRDALLGGGYNLYFRHAETDWSQVDQVSAADDWLSCDGERMRQLSEEGRADSRRIGDLIRRLEIPVSEVVASPYCRAMETARLMDVGEVQASTAVMNLLAASYFGGRAAIIHTARTLLATPPPAGGNRIIVAHGNVAREATPVYPGEGEAVVFQPDGNGGFNLIARIPPGAWEQMLAQ